MAESPFFPAPIMPDIEGVLRRMYEGEKVISPAARAVIAARFDGEGHFRGFRSFAAAMAFARHSGSQKYRKGPGQKMPSRHCSACCTRLHSSSQSGKVRGKVPADMLRTATICDHCVTSAAYAARGGR